MLCVKLLSEAIRQNEEKKNAVGFYENEETIILIVQNFEAIYRLQAVV